MSEPTTAAGRAHEDYCRTFLGDDAARDILAIEAEARRAALDEAIAAAGRVSVMQFSNDALYEAEWVTDRVIDALTRLRDGASPDSPEVR